MSEGPSANPSPIADAAIVSAFGRGDWLARELAGAGAHVLLIDVSESLLTTAAEAKGAEADPSEDDPYVDAEGPFGLFDEPSLGDAQKQNLFTGDSENVSAADRGACVWTEDGPIELRSELSEYQMTARGLALEVGPYLHWPDRGPDGARWAKRERGRLAARPFKTSWLAAFAHQAFATTYVEAPEILRAGSSPPLPLRAGFWVRCATRAAARASLGACERGGIRVLRDVAVGDIRLFGREVEALETRGAGPSASTVGSVEKAHAFIWCLSGIETAWASPRANSVLFFESPLRPAWRWMRARFALADVPSVRALPVWTALIGDRFLPWTHANLVVLRRNGDAFDAWLRLPSERAARNSDYAHEVFGAAQALLEARIPGGAPRLVRISREALAGPEKPAMQPVFALHELADAKRARLQNLFYDGPETWETLGRNGAIARQREILAEALAMKAKREARAAAIARKEQARAEALQRKSERRRPPPEGPERNA